MTAKGDDCKGPRAKKSEIRLWIGGSRSNDSAKASDIFSAAARSALRAAPTPRANSVIA
jgi:hypothetical protein